MTQFDVTVKTVGIAGKSEIVEFFDENKTQPQDCRCAVSQETTKKILTQEFGYLSVAQILALKRGAWLVS